MPDTSVEVHADRRQRGAAAGPNVALVHEWFTNRAGSETCVEALRLAFPRHVVYTSILAGSVFPELVGVTVSSLRQRAFARENGHLRAGPLLPLAMAALRIGEEHDLAIYSFHHFATWARAPARLPSIVYCHTPPRFIYRHQSILEERGLAMRLGRSLRSVARIMDRHCIARKGPEVVANSEAVADRIRSVYGLSPQVIHPPVEVERYQPLVERSPKDDYFLLVGRLVPYKRADVAIEAFRGLPHRLLVVGDGRMRAELERTAPKNVEFRGRVSDAELARLYAGSRALVFPNEEDFGITPAEAMAAGCPVVALDRGGVRDFLVEGTNGLLVEEQTVEALVSGVRAVAAATWDRHRVSESISWLGRERFCAEFDALARRVLQDDHDGW